MDLLKDYCWLVFGVLSLAAVVVGACLALTRYNKRVEARHILRPMQYFTFFVVIAVLCLMIPAMYYPKEGLGDEAVYVRPLILALNQTMRVFILDADFATITDSIATLDPWLHVAVSALGCVLYVLAPLLTFVNVLSIFKNVLGELKYKLFDKSPCYIFSELNQKSVALARSIRDKGEKADIVFTDVHQQGEEEDYELLLEARNLKALCVKKDIAHVDLFERKGKVELFLIGEDESENVSQAVKITAELEKKNKKHDVKIFVFSRKRSGAYIIDSVRYDGLLEYARQRDFANDTFKLRRINEVQQLVWHTVPEMDLFALAEKNGGTIPVLIAGMGSYGLEFFKMLLWFCQFEDYRLQLTVIDRQAAGMVEAMINRECPELLVKNRIWEEGESYYDIEIIPNIDVELADLDQLIHYKGEDPQKSAWAQRLRQTRVAIVGLGDDDLNIDVAVHLRSLFDQVYDVHFESEEQEAQIRLEDEPVQIYAVVYDEQKSGILQRSGAERSCFLRNHRNMPYHIRFIGAMSTQFHYDNIYDQNLEDAALAQHKGWVDLTKIANEDERAEVDRDMKNKHQKFEQYEYYRRSSMATELYQREVMEVPPMHDRVRCLNAEKSMECRCENCLRRMRSEHMRWDAYTRINGYSYGEHRADRAKRHNALKPWAQLPASEQIKDAGLDGLGENN